jgi:flagellar assembly protein FliH
LSRIIKQVQLNNLPVIINNLCLVISDDNETNNDEGQADYTPDLAAQVEARATVFIDKAKRDMEEQSAALYEQSRNAGFAEGQEQGYAIGKGAGYTDGFAHGEQVAKESMEAAVCKAAEEATRIIAEANRQSQLTILSAEKQILDIALAVAKKILTVEVDANSQAVLAIVKSAMDKVRNQTQITVRVNPSDFECVLAAKSEMEAILQREQSVEFAADQTVNRGGCVIDSGFGSVDAQLETQLQAISTIIRSLLP